MRAIVYASVLTTVFLGCSAPPVALTVCADGGGTFGDVNLASDPNNCGCLGRVCTASPHEVPYCERGQCTTPCAPGYAHCSADPSARCEVDIHHDVDNCGACGVVCNLPHASTSQCSDGRCVVERCASGWGDCNGDPADGCEEYLQTNRTHCGACRNACPGDGTTGQRCLSGRCGCPTGSTYCADSQRCVDLANDLSNCGGCGLRCGALPNGTPRCAQGMCVVSSCNAGWDDCDRLTTNGCEVDLRSAVGNCGACGMRCPGAPRANIGCQAGICQITSCDTGAYNCNHVYADGCENAMACM